jgi:hypothetical protein
MTKDISAQMLAMLPLKRIASFAITGMKVAWCFVLAEGSMDSSELVRMMRYLSFSRPTINAPAQTSALCVLVRITQSDMGMGSWGGVWRQAENWDTKAGHLSMSQFQGR